MMAMVSQVRVLPLFAAAAAYYVVNRAAVGCVKIGVRAVSRGAASGGRIMVAVRGRE